MRETFRSEERFTAVRVQSCGDKAAIGGGSPAHIHCHIKIATANNAHELGLGFGRGLEM